MIILMLKKTYTTWTLYLSHEVKHETKKTN
jgi:hypothetical protein